MKAKKKTTVRTTDVRHTKKLLFDLKANIEEGKLNKTVLYGTFYVVDESED
jgi:hypothetical protein